MKEGMLPIGTLLRGIYRVESQISNGGFGNTYEVVNIEFNERYALKEFFMKGINLRDDDQTTVSVSIAENVAQFSEQREKFKKEARRLRQLQNPHIVRVHDLFEENGTCYYVMDFIEGESLAAKLKRTGQPLPETEVRQLLIQILEALSEVHKNNLWHLDLKPGNIMINKDGNVVLIDFGASKQMSAEGGATTSTALCYTPGYAPSEQVEQNMEKCGPWTDLYALGATLFNLLTAQKPPQGSDIQESPEQAFAPLNGVSQQMQSYVRWLMQPNRTKRPQSVAEARRALNAHPSGTPTKMAPSKPISPKSAADTKTVVSKKKVQVEKKKSKAPLYAVVAIAVIACIAVGVFLLGKPSLKEEVNDLRAYHELPTQLDTLAYAIGMVQTQGLEEYLANTMNVDTTYKDEFCQGLLKGAQLTEAQPEKMGGSAEAAYNAGIQIGMQIYGQMLKGINNQLFDNDSTKSIPLKVLMAGFIQGLYTETRVMDIETANANATRLFEQITKENAKAQYSENIEQGRRFLEEKKRQSDVYEVPGSGGVLYKVLTQGTGEKPGATSKVTVDYEGRLIDGTVFDSSYERGEAVTFPLGTVIKGWQSALQQMPVGSEWEIYIPADQAYGEKETGNIKPYSTLIFKVKLHRIE